MVGIDEEGLFGWMEWMLPFLMRRRVSVWIFVTVGDKEWIIVPCIPKVLVLGGN